MEHAPAPAPDSKTSAPILQARGLSKSFGGKPALLDLDLAVHAGKVVCLLGPNGAGKTTTMNLFLGFLTPDSGAALVLGTEVHRRPHEARRSVAFVPENVMLYGELTGAENLAFFQELSTGERPSRETVLGWLAASGLPEDVADRAVERYSKGMRQRVGIAIARAKGARALLLDEPTSGLDPQASNELMEHLAQMKSEGLAVLMATHDIFRAHQIASSIAILKEGRLAAALQPEDIKAGDLERLYLEHMSA